MFFDHFAKDTGLATYGLKEVIQAMKAGNMEMLLISEGFNQVEATYKCSCGHEEKIIIHRDELGLKDCPNCHAKMQPSDEKDMMEELISMADSMNTLVEVISVHTRKGEQLKEIGGVAGILRFRQ